MFFSTSLLTTQNPMARVWLSANQERKMTKQQVLQHNIGESVLSIIEPEEAPFALRLSGHLLLGVVRIYGRKTRYLLDDCSDALMKIKMAFRNMGGNNDLPTNPAQALQNKAALILSNQLTMFDDIGSLPPQQSSNFDELMNTPLSRKTRSSNRDINLQEDFSNSQFLQDNGDEDEELAMVHDGDIGLDLDLGLDIDDMPIEKSMEMGRDAPAARDVEEDMLSDMDFAGPSKGREVREQSIGMDLDFGDGIQIADDEGDIRMGDDDFNFGDPSMAHADPSAIPDVGRARISESPLSDIDEEFAREVEMEYSRVHNSDMYAPEDDTTTTVVAPQRAKKRKLLQPDEQTMLPSDVIREQQTKRDSILKAPSFLPRDPYLLRLMEQQKNGDFVRNVLFDGRAENWAPELRGLICLDAISPAERKRKRDSGIADMDSEQEQGASKSPRLDLPEDEMTTTGAGTEAAARNQSVAADGTILELPGDDDLGLPQDYSEVIPRDMGSPGSAFDETTAPIVHPADSGPVSLGTKHAVHVLRDIFGAEAATDADKRKKSSIVFQDLLPEEKVTKADATKMFFECLVLATKDAIKVDQPEGSLGGPIRVRAKRGLWGDWAEREAGGEIAHQDEAQAQDAQQNIQLDEQRGQKPEPVIANTSFVSVEA